MWNDPEALATVVRVKPVATFFAVTVAPGTAALVSSKMLPSMLPVSDSAAHRAAGRAARASARARNRRRRTVICKYLPRKHITDGVLLRHAACHSAPQSDATRKLLHKP